MSTNINNKYKTLVQTNPELKEYVQSIENDITMAMRKMTHEFGNALTLINSSLQIIESSHPEVKGFKYWSSTISDVHYLINLVTEVSSYNNSRRLNLSETNIVSILQSIIDSYSCMNTSNNVDISLNMANNIPLICADYIKIKQVFINLIKNSFEALDLSKSSYIHITLKSADCNLIITIEDNGCGIPSDRLQKIFSPMVTFKDGGTGLGLTISQKIIEAHNGTIEVSSTEGVGTTFTISLPI